MLLFRSRHAGGLAGGVFFEIARAAVGDGEVAIKAAALEREGVEQVVGAGAEVHRVLRRDGVEPATGSRS